MFYSFQSMGSGMSTHSPQPSTSTSKLPPPSSPSSLEIDSPLTTITPPRGCPFTWSVTSNSKVLNLPFTILTSKFRLYLRPSVPFRP